MLDEVRAIAALIRALPAASRPKFEGGLSTAFGCTLEGRIPADKVVSLAEQLMQAGCDEVGLADTSGYANPHQVKELVTRVKAVVGEAALSGLHLHNTRGLGLANALAGLAAGITTLDSSLGGLGGCPFAPGASGNIVTEDLVFMLESMGIETGIDLPPLFAVRDALRLALPGEDLYGFTPLAGLPLGFEPASNRKLGG
jgi:hydroxymethylglutaryl-CoA lyase